MAGSPAVPAGGEKAGDSSLQRSRLGLAGVALFALAVGIFGGKRLLFPAPRSAAAAVDLAPPEPAEAAVKSDGMVAGDLAGDSPVGELGDAGGAAEPPDLRSERDLGMAEPGPRDGGSRRPPEQPTGPGGPGPKRHPGPSSAPLVGVGKGCIRTAGIVGTAQEGLLIQGINRGIAGLPVGERVVLGLQGGKITLLEGPATVRGKKVVLEYTLRGLFSTTPFPSKVEIQCAAH